MRSRLFIYTLQVEPLNFVYRISHVALEYMSFQADAWHVWPPWSGLRKWLVTTLFEWVWFLKIRLFKSELGASMSSSIFTTYWARKAYLLFDGWVLHDWERQFQLCLLKRGVNSCINNEYMSNFTYIIRHKLNFTITHKSR